MVVCVQERRPNKCGFPLGFSLRQRQPEKDAQNTHATGFRASDKHPGGEGGLRESWMNFGVPKLGPVKQSPRYQLILEDPAAAGWCLDL